MASYVIYLYSILLFSLLAQAQRNSYAWSKEKFPNPRKNAAPLCNLENDMAFICDPDHVLDIRQNEKLNQMISQFDSITQCPCSQPCEKDEGLRIGIAIMRRFNDTQDRMSNYNTSESLQKFADYIRKSWQLGTCDNSIIIAFAKDSEAAVISIGDQATNELSEAALKDLFSLNVPFLLSRSDHYKYLKDILQMFKIAINTKKARQGDANFDESNVQMLLGSRGGWTYYISIILIVIFFCLLVTFCVFLVIAMRRRNASGDDSKEQRSAIFRGLFSRDLWSRSGRSHSTQPSPIKVAPGGEPTKQGAYVYTEVPSGETKVKLQQTNLDDIPEMEADYDEEDHFPHATKV